MSDKREDFQKSVEVLLERYVMLRYLDSKNELLKFIEWDDKGFRYLPEFNKRYPLDVNNKLWGNLDKTTMRQEMYQRDMEDAIISIMRRM